MTDRYEKIRQALAMGPTPGPRRAVEQSVIGPQDLRILSANVTFSVGINGSHSVLIEEAIANATLAAACDPDTIQALLAVLAERDQLAAALEAARADAERWRALREMDGGEIYALLGDCDGIHPEQADAAIDAALAKDAAKPR